MTSLNLANTEQKVSDRKRASCHGTKCRALTPVNYKNSMLLSRLLALTVAAFSGVINKVEPE